jgi:hypothetical protein
MLCVDQMSVGKTAFDQKTRSLSLGEEGDVTWVDLLNFFYRKLTADHCKLDHFRVLEETTFCYKRV